MKSIRTRFKDFKDSLGSIDWLMLKFKRVSPFPQKKVLVLEGGGMRGIFLTGVLQAFTDRAYFPWKLIIGSSAGALTGTAYAASQIHLARDAFFTELLTGEFIKISNIVRLEKHILNLDWMIDKDKIALDVSAHENLQHALLGIFDSQIAGGKRYDLATMGRRRAHATYHATHGVDVSTGITFAMDLTPLISDTNSDISGYVQEYIDRLSKDIRERLSRLI